MHQAEQKQRHIVYKSVNPIIQLIGKRFTNGIESLLLSIDARHKLGLDLGCGEGHLLNRLITRGCLQSIVACDLSTTNLLNAQHSYPDFTFLQANGEQLPIKNSCFDFVMATEILEHVKHPDAVLKEIVRISKPSANFIISVPHEPFFHLCALSTGKHIRRLGKTPKHLSFWGRQTFRNLLSEYMIIERCHTISTFPWQLYLCKATSR